MKRKIVLISAFVFLAGGACTEGKTASDGDMGGEQDAFFFDSDAGESDDAENALPEKEALDPDTAVDDETDDGTNDTDDGVSDETEKEEGDEDPLLSDLPVPDEESLPFCFEKPCDSHGSCDHIGGACTPYFNKEQYACAPDLEEFGYRGRETCVEVNCKSDADCRQDLGYVCLDFGAPSAEFNGAGSACLRSLSGSPCDEEGKKVCQFGKNIAITCTDGVWKPYFCEEGSHCEAGVCIVEVPEGTDDLTDADLLPPVEICDGIDNTGEGNIDEGCDDDGDGWCDITMLVYGQPPICPNGTLDCDDGDPSTYPGSTIHQEGKDYDCDNRKEYLATIVITVDDQLVDLCVNGAMVLPLGIYYGNWTRADTYTVIMESGMNSVGVHGIDTGMVISAFMATVTVNGGLYITDGVMPPADGIAYTPADPEWFGTEWRYFPTVQEGPNADWCDKWFDDSGWGPGIRAGMTGSTPIDKWGQLGAYPWTNTSCGCTRCPCEFLPYYQDAIPGNEPMWIWDYNPTTLADAWLRRVIVLP